MTTCLHVFSVNTLWSYRQFNLISLGYKVPVIFHYAYSIIFKYVPRKLTSCSTELSRERFSGSGPYLIVRNRKIRRCYSLQWQCTHRFSWESINDSEVVREAETDAHVRKTAEDRGGMSIPYVGNHLQDYTRRHNPEDHNRHLHQCENLSFD
jgi:hypothetical protein